MKPSRSWKRIDVSFEPSTAATIVCFPLFRASPMSASISSRRRRSPVVLSHVHRVLHSEPIPRPPHDIAEPPESRDADDLLFLLGHQDNLVFVQPFEVVVGCVGGVSPLDGSRCEQRFQNRPDRRASASARRSYHHPTHSGRSTLARPGGLSWIGSPLPGSGGPARGEEFDPGLGWMAQEVVDPDVRGATSPNLEHRSEMEKLSLPRERLLPLLRSKGRSDLLSASRPCTRHGHSTVERSHDAHHRRALTHAVILRWQPVARLHMCVRTIEPCLERPNMRVVRYESPSTTNRWPFDATPQILGSRCCSGAHDHHRMAPESV